MRDSIINYLIAVGFMQTLIFIVALASKRNALSRSSLLLVGLLTIVAMEILYGWLYLNNLILDLPHLLRVNTPIVLLVGPGIFLFVRTTLGHPMRKSDLLHLVPFVICIIYFLPLFSSSFEAKTIYIDRLYKELSFDSYFWGGLRRMQQLTYLLLSASTIYNWVAGRGQMVKSAAVKQSMGLLAAFSSIWLLDIYRYFFRFDLLSGVLDTIVLSSFAIAMVLIGLRIGRDKKLPNSNSKYETSALNAELRQFYRNKIEQGIKQSKLYLNPNVSLPQLSAQLAIRPHYVSQIINQDLETNFSDYINLQRVNEAKALLCRQETQHLKIEAIAHAVGFNSISTFNAAFKKFTNSTPRHFRIGSLAQAKPTTL